MGAPFRRWLGYCEYEEIRLRTIETDPFGALYWAATDDGEYEEIRLRTIETNH